MSIEEKALYHSLLLLEGYLSVPNFDPGLCIDYLVIATNQMKLLTL